MKGLALAACLAAPAIASVPSAGDTSDDAKSIRSVVRLEEGDDRIALRDLDGDGALDIVFVTPGGLAARFLRADGSYPETHDALLAWPAENLAWSLVDLEGDGTTEVALLVDGSEVRLHRATPEGFDEGTKELNARAHLPGGVHRMSFFRDVDADGRLDLVLPSFGSYAIHRRSPAGGWEAPLTVRLELEIDHSVGNPDELDSSFGQDVGIPWFTLEDVDGDGDLDLIAETDDEVYFHLAEPDISGDPTWVLDVAALKAELPEQDGIDFDDILAEGARIVDWKLGDIDGEGANDLVIQVGSKFRVYPGGSKTGPVGTPGQVLKSSGAVFCFFLRDVSGDDRPDLQLMRGDKLSLARMLRWLVFSGSYDLVVYTYQNDDGSFTRRPTRENTLTISFPRLLSFAKDMEELEEELEIQGKVPTRRADLGGDGDPNDVVDLLDGDLVVYFDSAPKKDPTEEIDEEDVDALLELLILHDLDALEPGGTKTIDLGEIDEWLEAPAVGLREACAGREPDRRVKLENALDGATIYVRDLDGNGITDFVVAGRDANEAQVLQFVVNR